MSDGSSVETYANHTNAATGSPPGDVLPAAPRSAQDIAMRRALVLIGIATACGALAYAIVRASLKAVPADPTTERIQQLIDEANRLLKALDEKKPE